MAPLPDTAYRQPPKRFPHTRNCPTCVTAKDEARRRLLALGYSQEDAERLAWVTVRARLACGWDE